MFLLKCFFLNLLILQSTQVFANRALDRAVAADGLRTGYYNPNPADARIPGQTDIVLEEFSKRPSSETANLTQKKQMAQAMMRTAAIHSRYKDAAYQQVGATQRDLDHFTCMRIIRNVSNYLIDQVKNDAHWNEEEPFKGIVESLITPQYVKELEVLTRLSRISQGEFTDWFVEAVSDLHEGLNKSTAWYWRDQEERAASASASSAGAGGGGVQAGAGGAQPRAAAVAPTTISDLVGNELSLYGEHGVYTVFKNTVGIFGASNHEDIKRALLDQARSKYNLIGISFKDYENDLYAKLSAIYEEEQSALVVHAPAPLPVAHFAVPVPEPRAGLNQAGAGGISDHIVDFYGKNMPLLGSNGVICIYKLFINITLHFKDKDIIKDRLKNYIKKHLLSVLILPEDQITPAYLEDLYTKLSAIYEEEQAEEKAPPPPPAPVFAPPPPAVGAQLGPVVAVNEAEQQQFLRKWFFKQVREALVMPIEQIRDEALPVFYGIDVANVIMGQGGAFDTFITSFLFENKLQGNGEYEKALGHSFPLFFKSQQRKHDLASKGIVTAFLEGGGVFWRGNRLSPKGAYQFNETRVNEILEIIQDAEHAGSRLIFIPGVNAADGGSGHWYSLNIEIKSPGNIAISVFHTGAYDRANDTSTDKGSIKERMQELTHFLQSKGYIVENLSEFGTRMQKETESCAIALMRLYEEFFKGNFTNLSDIVRAKDLGQGNLRREKWVATDPIASDFREFSLDQEQRVVKEIIHEALHEMGATQAVLSRWE